MSNTSTPQSVQSNAPGYEPNYDPQSGSGLPQRPSTTSLTTLLRYALRQHDKQLHKAMPARVERVISDYYVDIQPGNAMRFRKDKTPAPLPIIPQVPVLMLQGQSYGLHVPVKEGDTGIIIILDRAVDAWLASAEGRATDPNDPRLHSLADAVFLPGLSIDKVTDAAPTSNGDLTLNNGKAKLTMKPTGKLSLGNGTAELVSIVSQLALEVTKMAAAVPYTSANLAIIQKAIDALKV